MFENPTTNIFRQRPLRLVLDTNVIMALWHFADPKLAQLSAFVEAAHATLLTRPSCLTELQRVLAYVQFGIDPQRQLGLYDAYAQRACCLPDADPAQEAYAQTLPRCGDKDDQKFISLSWDGEAHVLVTRDKLLLKLARRAPLRERMAILTPERLQAQLFEAHQDVPAQH